MAFLTGRLRQVSWCKLEVRVEGHKNVSAKCPGQQETPPLVVAALNLKTSLHPQAKHCSISSRWQNAPTVPSRGLDNEAIWDEIAHTESTSFLAKTLTCSAAMVLA